MDTNNTSNIYTVLTAVEEVQSKLIHTNEINFDSYFKTTGYNAQRIKENEWILTSADPANLIMDKATGNMNYIFCTIFHNYNARIMDILSEDKIKDPSNYLFAFINCPSFFYKILMENKDSIRVII